MEDVSKIIGGMKKKETPEEKEKRLKQDRDRKRLNRLNETPEARKIRLEKERERYRKRKESCVLSGDNKRAKVISSGDFNGSEQDKENIIPFSCKGDNVRAKVSHSNLNGSENTIPFSSAGDNGRAKVSQGNLNGPEQDKENFNLFFCAVSDKTETIAERRQRERDQESHLERLKRLQDQAIRDKIRRQQESPQEREMRLQNQALRDRSRREQESSLEREKRLRNLAERNNSRREQESPLEREKRLRDLAERNKSRREQESPLEREKRLRDLAERNKSRREQESPLEREKRLRDQALRDRSRREQESSLEREKRLRNLAERNRSRVAQAESPRHREKRLAKSREKRQEQKLANPEEWRAKQDKLNEVARNKRKAAKENGTVTPSSKQKLALELSTPGKFFSQTPTMYVNDGEVSSTSATITPTPTEKVKRLLFHLDETCASPEERSTPATLAVERSTPGKVLTQTPTVYVSDGEVPSTSTTMTPTQACATPEEMSTPATQDDFDVVGPAEDNDELKPIGHYIPLLTQQFLKSVEEGPNYCCSCCGRLFFKTSVIKLSPELLNKWAVSQELRALAMYVNQPQHYLCGTCKVNIKDQKKHPKLALADGLDFPPIPPQLQGLNQLEQRLVAPRIPYMQISLVGFQKQWLMKGNIVNVENDLNMCVKHLPRSFDESGVIQLKLMRRMMYNKPYLYQKIRPAKVLAAAKYLVSTPMFKDEGITLADVFNDTNEEVEFNLNGGEVPTESYEGVEHENEAMAEYVDDTEDIGQVDEAQTFLFQDDAYNIGIKIAPGEGKTPIPYFKDPNAEFLSFPGIYCGQYRRLKNEKVYQYEIVRSELERFDRRCANPEKLFFSYKLLFNQRIHNQFFICLRQRQTSFGGQSLTAGMLRDDVAIQNIIAKDDGYSVYKDVRGTPAYWKEECRRVIAMIRQLGCPTFFFTLTAAESKWRPLLKILLNIQNFQQVEIDKFLNMSMDDIKKCLEDDILNLSHEARAKLISSDPVTCMRYFYYKFSRLLATLFKPARGVFDPFLMEDHFARVEFQARGAPHMHGLLWLNEAPRFDPNVEGSREKVTDFIDNYINCRRDVEDEELQDLVLNQNHKHSQTCKKTNRSVRVCRFNYPKPPLTSTVILDPLPKDFCEEERGKLTKIYTRVEEKLNDWGRDYRQNTTVEEMLGDLNISYADYLNSIRTTIKRSTVFLQRLPKEAFVNAYNTHILKAWKANMDIQYVLDGYACAKYVASYISKSGGGVSKMLRVAAADVNDGNLSIRHKLERFGSVLIRGTEISAQEAAAYAIGIPMVNCSRDVVFANTAESSKRIRMLKPKAQLSQLPETSVDIYIKGAAERYANRPDNNEMRDICYAEFLTKWTTVAQAKKESQNTDEADPDAKVCEDEDRSQEANKYRERDTHKLLRFCNFSKGTDPENYWREQLLLFLPWRNEVDEIQNPGNFYERAKENEEIIIKNSRPYYYSRKDLKHLEDPHLELNLDSIFAEEEQEEEEYDHVSEAANHQNNLDEEDEINFTSETVTGRIGKRLEIFRPPEACDNEEYNKIMRELNPRQRQIVQEISYRLKTRDDPFYIYLAGGAGVGKSHVVTAIIQTYIRFCLKDVHYPTDAHPVIVGAPTGRAAFNVMGMTIHNIFRLPPNQKPGPINKLDESTAQTLRVRFAYTRLFIIDEISMVGAIQLQHIDERLRQIFHTPHTPFGGRSVLVVGDLRQLPPVGMKAVFKCPELSAAEKVRSLLVAENPLWSMFQFFELAQIMRQRDEHAFAKALNNMAKAEMDHDDIALIKRREVTKEQAPKDAVWLFLSNAECEQFNKEFHSTLRTGAFFSKAEHVVTKEGVSEGEKQLAIRQAELLPRQDNEGLLNEVNLQIGALYLVTYNIDVSDGLFNGATGVMKALEFNKNTGKLEAAWLHFCHPSIGNKVRQRPSVKSRAKKNGYDIGWTPITFISRRLNKAKTLLEMTRIQIPLQAANGMTICKSQGSSLPHVVVSLPQKRGITRENLYVACSRATTYNKFYIVGKFSPPTPGENDCSREIQRLRTCPVQFKLKFPDQYNKPSSIYYHNVDGFNTYMEHFVSDINVLLHHYLIFVEPKSLVEDDVSLPSYNLICRIDCPSESRKRNSEGILFFVHENAPLPTNVRIHKEKEGTGHYLIVTAELPCMQIVSGYKHPSYAKAAFLKKLEEIATALPQGKPVTIFGDFNINIKEKKLQGLFQPLVDLGFQFVIEDCMSTTENNTNIDVCLSNSNECEAGVYEIYYTHHKALTIHF